MRYALLLILVSLLLCGVAYATPSGLSISKNITESSNGVSGFVISGANFGIKSPAKPYLWAPFDSDINPSNLGTITSWSATNAIGWDSDEGVGGGGCAKATDSSGNWTARVNATGFAWNDYGQKMYLYRKLKKNFDIATADDGGVLNWKEWRVWTAAGSGGVEVNSYYQTDNGTATTEYVTFPLGFLYATISLSGLRGPQDEYYTNEVLYVSNSEGENASSDVGDGTFEIRNNNTRVFYVPYTAYNGARYWKNRQSDSGNMTQNYFIHGVKANATLDGSARYWVDDVYADITWSRVMLGNNATFANCTHCEIQIPTAWADDSITFTANMGTFTGTDNIYLFVVDSTGAVNSTGLLVSGASGGGDEADTTPPSIAGLNPSDNATGIAYNTSIVFSASDGASGIDLDSLTLANAVSVNGVNYASGLSTSGDKSSVTCTLDTNDYGQFDPGEVVTVGVNIKDLSENSVLETWDFTIEDNAWKLNGEMLTFTKALTSMLALIMPIADETVRAIDANYEIIRGVNDDRKKERVQ